MDNAFDWLKSLNLDDIPKIKTKAMWCGHRSHPDYSTRFPWIVKELFSKFGYRQYVEIGIAGGGGLDMAYKFSKDMDSLIVGIDPLEKHPENKTVSHPVFVNKNVHLIRKKSHDAVDDLKELLIDKPIDILIIDGDHSYDGAIGDFLAYFPLMSVGGLVWFDDVAHCAGVAKAWKKMKARKTSCPIPYEYWDWGIGEIEGGKCNKKGRRGIDGVWLVRL